MRSCILSEVDRTRLKNWVEMGEEDQTTRNMFTRIRITFPLLMDDIMLIIQVRKKLKEKKRWARKPRSGSR